MSARYPACPARGVDAPQNPTVDRGIDNRAIVRRIERERAGLIEPDRYTIDRLWEDNADIVMVSMRGWGAWTNPAGASTLREQLGLDARRNR